MTKRLGVDLFDGGLIVDLFAGGGGASRGIEAALGRPVDIGINHDPVALAVHKANHPATRHVEEDIWRAKPEALVRGRRVALLWASPDCTHFSTAKGGKPRKKKLRTLAWAVYRWAKATLPAVIFLEPHELLRAQFGRFAADYDLSPARTKTAMVRLIGNSVCPEVAEALVRANATVAAVDRRVA